MLRLLQQRLAEWLADFLCTWPHIWRPAQRRLVYSQRGWHLLHTPHTAIKAYIDYDGVLSN